MEVVYGINFVLIHFPKVPTFKKKLSRIREKIV